MLVCSKCHEEVRMTLGGLCSRCTEDPGTETQAPEPPPKESKKDRLHGKK